jgi:3-dehydroquinate synthetase
VGVDLPEGKNLVGAFHHPSLVVADLAFLRSLPRRELAAGYAEVIKHGLIGDPALFTLLEGAGADLLDLPADLTARVVPQAMAVKIEVVQDDVREAGRRAILNYGHSVGHALEVATGYRALLHGEAVAFGMAAAAALSQRLGLLDAEIVRRQNRALRAVGLLGALPAVREDDVIGALGYDKKVHAGRLRWVLLRALGDPLISADVPPSLVREVVHDLLSGTLSAGGSWDG